MSGTKRSYKSLQNPVPEMKKMLTPEEYMTNWEKIHPCPTDKKGGEEWIDWAADVLRDYEVDYYIQNGFE